MISRSDHPRGQKPLPDIGPYFGLRIPQDLSDKLVYSLQYIQWPQRHSFLGKSKKIYKIEKLIHF